MLIPFTAPYDLRGTLCGGQAFRWREEDDGWFCGVIFGNVVRMRRVDEGIEFVSAPDDETSLAPLVRDYLRVDDDMDEVYAALSEDEHLSDAVKQHRGLRVLRQEPWECLVGFICSANNNIPRITANVEDMALHYGSSLPGHDLLASANGDGDGLQGCERNVFPTARQLVDAGEQALRDLKLGFRAVNVIAAAEGIVEGEGPDLYSLREADYEDALAELVKLRGIADKVANCVMLFSLDKPQAFPVDVWIVKAMRDWYPDAPVPPALNSNGNKTTPTEKHKREMREWALERYGKHAGYANQYMFHHKRWVDLVRDSG